MNTTWKLSIMGAVALAASSAVMAVGCTVTTTNGPLDGGGDDASTSDGGGDAVATDSPVGDTGGDGGTCSATTSCAIIASSGGVTFDNCDTCDKCSATSCCSQVTACFADVDGGESDCYALFKCLLVCADNDAGIDPNSCKDACRAGHTPEAYNALVAADNCQSTSCSAACGGDIPDASTD